MRRRRVIGLTGNIGSGKSTVAKMLGELGADVIDADQVARDVVRPGLPAFDEIIAEFGPAALAKDGTIDRKALGARVFGDSVARRRLEVRESQPRFFGSSHRNPSGCAWTMAWPCVLCSAFTTADGAPQRGQASLPGQAARASSSAARSRPSM